MKHQLAKLSTILACAAVFVVGVIQPACVGVYYEPDMSPNMFK